MKIILTSSQKTLILLVLFFITLYLVSKNSHPFLSCKSDDPTAKNYSSAAWKYPDIGSIPRNEEGNKIQFGRNIFIETFKYIGPDVPDPNMRFAGNNMDCQNCHFNAGTQQYVFGLVGVYSAYPKLDPRTDKVITLQERINSCMTRSLNGKPLPENSNEMNALVAYLQWLSTDVPKGVNVSGQGVPKIPLLNRAADTAAGRIVYLDNCASCHADNGEGALNKPGDVVVPADSLRGYDMPPVWGNESYNNGAGLYRLLTTAAFIFAKMPLNRSNLSIEKAYDVAAFINSQPRPNKADLEKDYPNLNIKPIDFPFPPFNDSLPASQHRYGPFTQMMTAGQKIDSIKPD